MARTSQQIAKIVTGYAQRIVTGKIPACKWTRLACQRHMDDLERSKASAFAFRFDAGAARRVINFVELQHHTKGQWAAKGERLILSDWEIFFVACIFGWLEKATGLRRFRRAMLLVARKNGKSQLAAAIGLYMVCADGEHGAEVYSGATSEKQALEIFRPAQIMARHCPEMREQFGVAVNASNINVVSTNSRFEPVIGKPGDGASPSCALIDEYHEHKTNDLMQTMETGMGARTQPLSLIVTTAGDNLGGPCYAMRDEAHRMLDGAVENDRFFFLEYGIDDGDDWTKPEALAKANPNMGVSVFKEYLLHQQAEAIGSSRLQGEFQTKHLNVWVGARNAFFNVERWRAAAMQDLKITDFLGRDCVLGLDLSSKIDIAALEIVFPLGGNRFAVFGRHYLPEATIMNPKNDHYQGWMRDGRLIMTDGEIIDYDRIHDDILDLATKFHVREVAFDPYQATMLVTSLVKDGIPCVEVRPTVLNLSEPMKFLDAIIRAGQISHDGDPCMTWMIGNVVAAVDAKDNVYPRKNRPEDKIDGPVALISALARCIICTEDAGNIDDFLKSPLSIRL